MYLSVPIGTYRWNCSVNHDLEIRFGLSDVDSGVFGGVDGPLDGTSVAPDLY